MQESSKKKEWICVYLIHFVIQQKLTQYNESAILIDYTEAFQCVDHKKKCPEKSVCMSKTTEPDME